MRKCVVAAVCLLFVSSVAQAGPVVPGDIAHDAKWFGHINIEAVHSMEAVQDLRAKMEENDRVKDRMAEMAKKTGVNPAEDLLGVTIYATQYEGDVGVGLFYLKKFDAEKLVAMLKEKHSDVQTSNHGDRVLYTWLVKHRRGEMELTGAIASENLIVIGAGEAEVKAALDVIGGKKDGLEADASLLAAASKNSLFASNAIDVPSDYQKTTKCPVLKKCDAASVNWMEKKGKITAKYEFTTKSEEMANGFKGIIDGAIAMADLRIKKMDAVKKVLDGLKYKAKGNVFSVTWKTTTDDIEAAVKQAMESRRH